MMTDSLFVMPKNVQTRWASPENWDGAKGAAGQANGGRKGSACFTLKAGEQKVILNANPDIAYEVVVATMDAARGKMIESPSSDPQTPDKKVLTAELFGTVLLSAGVN